MNYRELAAHLRLRDVNGINEFNETGPHGIDGKLNLVHDRAKDALMGVCKLLDMLAEEQERHDAANHSSKEQA